jgi:hypothetical protein
MRATLAGVAMRSKSAHPGSQGAGKGFWEKAILMAQKADELWKRCFASGVSFY